MSFVGIRLLYNYSQGIHYIIHNLLNYEFLLQRHALGGQTVPDVTLDIVKGSWQPIVDVYRDLLESTVKKVKKDSK